MQKRKFRIVSVATAGSLALAVVAITANSGTSPTAKHVALAAQAESSPSVNLDNCPVLYTGYPRGGCVAQLQTELNTILGLNLSADGIFGPTTKKAVEEFQQEHNIVPADGIVGPQTKAALGNPGSISAGTPTGQLNPGQQITSGTQIASPDGRFVLQMQSDGNLVLRAPGNLPVGDTHTAGHDGTIAVMQTDGNFVLRAPGNIPVWASGTDGHPGTVLQVQDDGDVVLYAPGHQVLHVIFPARPNSEASAPVPAAPSATVPALTSSPDYKVVRYIHSFSITHCTLSFVTSGVPGGLGACLAIDATANPTPAADIASTTVNWTNFQNSDEYRSIVHLPSYQMTCTSTGELTGLPTPTNAPGISAGFTPVHTGVHTFHVAGEKYQDQGGIWYNVNPQISMVTPSTARITYRVAARAGTAENDGNPAVSGYSLPFIWTLVQEQLSCGKVPATLVTYSQMPSVMVFQDGARVLADIQTTNLGGFVKAGGFGNVQQGHGKLYVPCRAFGMGQLAGIAITPDCASAASPEPSWAPFPAP